MATNNPMPNRARNARSNHMGITSLFWIQRRTPRIAISEISDYTHGSGLARSGFGRNHGTNGC